MSWPALRSPSLQLTTEESRSIRMQQRMRACTDMSLTVCVCNFTGLLVECVSQKEEDNAKCNKGCPPSQQEHDNHTTNSTQERQPFTVIPKGWAPTWRHIHMCVQTNRGPHTLKEFCIFSLYPITLQCGHFTVFFSLPGELVMEAWKQLKLIKEYEQRKKLEMIGAMVFNSAGGGKGQSGYHVHTCFNTVI